MAISRTRSSLRSALLRGAALLAITVAVASCASKNNPTTGSIPTTSKPIGAMNATELRGAADSIGKAYEKNPRDPQTGMNYASVLRMNGRNDQALAVMQQVAISNPDNREVLAAYGKAQAAAGQLQQALDTILRAQTPDRPDWKLKSAEGAILDQLGRSGEARQRYREALDLRPNEPSVLSNLGMSYLLTRDLKTAETYLRSAAGQPGADSSVRQNLALTVGLQGRFQEAETIARQELTAAQAEANVTYLRSMLTQQNAWKKLAADDSGSTN
ncbi:tetratricopeptide repeat protein [Shinella zoogloeoides]